MWWWGDPHAACGGGVAPVYRLATPHRVAWDVPSGRSRGVGSARIKANPRCRSTAHRPVCSSCHRQRPTPLTLYSRMKLVLAVTFLVALAAMPAPLSAAGFCVDSMPILGNAQPSSKPPPYVITAAPTTVRGGDTVKVVVSGSEKFHSVYLLARHGEEAVGEFVVPAGQGCRAGVFGCPRGQKNAFSFNSRGGTNVTEVEWKAPQINGKVAFRATIVKSFTEFWVGVESSPITVGSAAA